MKALKKLSAFLLSGLLFLSATACTDKSWAVKTEAKTISSGIYHYFLFESYQQAVDKLSTDGNTMTDLSGQAIDGKDASVWVRDTAVDHCKSMLATEKMFEDKGLSLSDDETREAQENTDSVWENSGETLSDKYGIDKESFHQAYSIYPLEVDKLFDTIYGKDGENQISDEEITTFYNENYVNMLIYSKIAYNGEGEDDGVDHSNDTAEKIDEQFKSYAEMINTGAKTINEVSDMIKQTDSLDTDPFVNQLINKNSADVPAAIKNVIMELEVGKAAYTKFNEVFFLFYKQDNAAVPIDLSDEEEREKILFDMNSANFEEMIEETKNNMQFSINEAVINGFDISIFAQ